MELQKDIVNDPRCHRLTSLDDLHGCSTGQTLVILVQLILFESSAQELMYTRELKAWAAVAAGYLIGSSRFRFTAVDHRSAYHGH